MVDNNSTNCTLSQDTIAVAPLSSVRRGRETAGQIIMSVMQVNIVNFSS